MESFWHALIKSKRTKGQGKWFFFFWGSGRICQVGDGNEDCWSKSHCVNELITLFINNNGNTIWCIKVSAESTYIIHHDPYHNNWRRPSECTAGRWDSKMVVSERYVVRKKAMPVKTDLKSIPEFQSSSSNQTCLNYDLWHLHDLVSYHSEYPSYLPVTSFLRLLRDNQHNIQELLQYLGSKWERISVSVRECWKLCGIADCVLNIQESVEQLKSVTLISY